ncbi:MAG: hypothetical protein ACPGWR_22160, partial [Ardenticatenaceae bacterium]
PPPPAPPPILGEGSYSPPLVLGATTRGLLLENPTGWALRLGDWKALANTDDDTPYLFNLRTDPGERRPLADSRLSRELITRAAALRQAADERAKTITMPVSDNQIDQLVLERLRGLGYL